MSEGLSQLGHQVRTIHRDELVDGKTVSRTAERLLLPQIASRAAEKLHPKDYDVVFSSSGMLYPLFDKMGPGKTKRIHYLPGAAFFDHQATLQEATRGHIRISPLYRHFTGKMPPRWDLLGARSADGTIVNCLRDRDYLVDQGSAENEVAFIPLPVHPEVLRLRQHMSDAPARLTHSAIWFGSWSDRKGIAYLPRAWSQVLARFPKAGLTIGGTARSRDEVLSAFSGMDTSNIRVLGRVNIEEQVREFERHSVFLFPSLSEGFGFSLLEAMACGLASVTTSTGLGGDLITHGHDALIVPPASSTHLASGILNLFEHDALRIGLGARARSNAEQYTLERCAREYASFFKQMMDS